MNLQFCILKTTLSSCAPSPPQRRPNKAEKYSDWEGADDVTFNALISAFEKGRQWQLALHILRVPWMTKRREWKETYTKPTKLWQVRIFGRKQGRIFYAKIVRFCKRKCFFAEKRYTFVVSFQLWPTLEIWKKVPRWLHYISGMSSWLSSEERIIILVMK